MTRKAIGRDSDGWAVIDPATEWSMSCNTPLWPLLGLTGGRIGPIRSIGRSYQAQALNMFYPDRTFKSALAASSQPISVGWLKAVAEGQLRWENSNLTSAENLKLETARKPTLNSGILVTYRRLSQVSPLVNSQYKLDSVVGSGVQGQRKIYSIYGVIKLKKNKRNLSESYLKNEAADFPRFIVIESLEEVCLVKFSSFLIEKVISPQASPKTVKKTRNGNFIVDTTWHQGAADIRWNRITSSLTNFHI